MKQCHSVDMTSNILINKTNRKFINYGWTLAFEVIIFQVKRDNQTGVYVNEMEDQKKRIMN